ncbi:hypothetical protein AWZ03_015084 [Drosophila navojoa]|uniref:Uncharacterized protein n=1 Tax=Drosophila navojoa TaxID=7232 RepID=A0A484APP2_DRONA|nr:hypothetical protein AWZ03_015084 [Drosophila navojoa]
MENEVVTISSDEEWEESRATPVRLEDGSGEEETLPQGSPWEDQPHTDRIHSIHHSTIDVSVTLEDMIMVLRGNLTTVNVQAPGVQRTPPHVEEPTFFPGSSTPSQPETHNVLTNEESERWASPTPWTASEGEDEDQLPPREAGSGREHCPSVPNPASRVASRAEAGEPKELWNSTRVAFRYIPGAVENIRRLAEPVCRSERASGRPWADRRDRYARSHACPNVAETSSYGGTTRRRRQASFAEPQPKWRKLDDSRMGGSNHQRELGDVLEGWLSDEASWSSVEDGAEREAFLSIRRMDGAPWQRRLWNW